MGYVYRSSTGAGAGLLAQMVYPDGRVVDFRYGRAGGDAAGPSGRLAEITDAGGGVYASYSYIGVDTVVRADYSLVQGGLRQSYGSSAAGYDGLDGPGRITALRWTQADGTQVDGYAYGYDGSGNRTYKQNLTATGLDELYSYDALGRLTLAQRGTLNEGKTAITSASLTQGWTLDGVGNWSGYRTDAGDGTTWDENQTRDPSLANEISSITAQDGTPQWLTPTYDADGNMISAPKSGYETDASQRQLYIYDAWNRLVKLAVDNNGNSTTETTDANGVYDAGSDLVIAQYFYDGLGRRIAKSVAVYGTGENFATITGWQRTDFYFNESWQVLEERTGLVAANSPTTVVTLSTSGMTLTQYVWDALYVDTPIVRDVDTGGNGVCTDSTDQHLYYLTDANHNVTGMVSLSGHVVERYCYSSYGALAIFNGQTDLAGNTTTDWSSRTNNISLAGNTVLYTGLAMDFESALYAADHRYYANWLGVWISRDPAGDGNSLYEYCNGDPASMTDSKGLWGEPSDTPPGITLSPEAQDSRNRMYRNHQVNAEPELKINRYSLAVTASVLEGEISNIYALAAEVSLDFAIPREYAASLFLTGCNVGEKSSLMIPPDEALQDFMDEIALNGPVKTWTITSAPGTRNIPSDTGPNDSASTRAARQFDTMFMEMALSLPIDMRMQLFARQPLYQAPWYEILPGIKSAFEGIDCIERGGNPGDAVFCFAGAIFDLWPSRGISKGVGSCGVRSANLIREAIHGNSLLSPRTAYLYRLETQGGEFLKWGVTQNMATRYSQSFMRGKYISEFARGTRADMILMERGLVETQPGPLNFERWAGSRIGGQP